MTLQTAEMQKFVLDVPLIAQELKAFSLPDVDIVVGIGTGGIVPASLVAYQLECPLKVIRLNYRAADNTPQREAPELLAPFELEGKQRVLLVDDVSVSGQTLHVAERFLTGHRVTSFVLKGKADLVLFPQVATCIYLPWRDG